MQPFNEELKILVDALWQIGIKGEVKVAEWIRGSSVAWTNAYNKKSLSYGNHFAWPYIRTMEVVHAPIPCSWIN